MPAPARSSSHPLPLPGCGMPQERLIRIAARRAFVDAKQCFSRCVEALDATAPLSVWLAREVRQAQTPEDLWLLRNALSAALRRHRAPLNWVQRGPSLSTQLRRTLDTLFPDRFEPSGFGDTLE
jgi:hypothetical protein